jgi:phage-related protein
LEKTCCARNGGGRSGCRYVGRWVRTDLPTRRTARVLLCLHKEHLVALHGFIKKTRATPEDDLALARKRQKELKR